MWLIQTKINNLVERCREYYGHDTMKRESGLNLILQRELKKKGKKRRLEMSDGEK